MVQPALVYNIKSAEGGAKKKANKKKAAKKKGRKAGAKEAKAMVELASKMVYRITDDKK